MFVRVAVYERLFGPACDWLLAQSYEDAAKEHEQKTREHREFINELSLPSVARSSFR
jgi:hypothetical protein